MRTGKYGIEKPEDLKEKNCNDRDFVITRLFQNLITLPSNVSKSCNLSECRFHSFKHSKRYNNDRHFVITRLFQNLITLPSNVSKSCNLSECRFHSFKHSKRYNRAKTKTCHLPGYGPLLYISIFIRIRE